MEIVPMKDLLVLKKTILFWIKRSFGLLLFLLSGRVSVWNEISWNSNNIIEYLEPLEVLGLIEYLNHTNYYTAYILAESKCTIFRIKTEQFIQILQNNNTLCFQMLLFWVKSRRWIWRVLKSIIFSPPETFWDTICFYRHAINVPILADWQELHWLRNCIST